MLKEKRVHAKKEKLSTLIIKLLKKFSDDCELLIMKEEKNKSKSTDYLMILGRRLSAHMPGLPQKERSSFSYPINATN